MPSFKLKPSFPALTTILVLGIFVADLLTKHLFFSLKNSAVDSKWHLITFTHHQNFGLVFDLPFPRSLLIGLSILILFLVLISMRSSFNSKNYHKTLALALILGGALGNLSDRLLFGYVRDWLLVFGRSALNFADVAIGVGILWYVWVATKTSKDRPDSSRSRPIMY